MKEKSVSPHVRLVNGGCAKRLAEPDPKGCQVDLDATYRETRDFCYGKQFRVYNWTFWE